MEQLKKQVGGSHYTRMKYQPIELAVKCGFTFVQGSCLKYLSRYLYKNGEEDIMKLDQFCELGIALLDTTPPVWLSEVNRRELAKYADLNQFTDLESDILSLIAHKKYDEVRARIPALLANYETHLSGK